jgi:mannose-6-phosphate isomerase-like protein (cupin superfamily)
MFRMLNYSHTLHDDHEDVYYIINGIGKIKIGSEETGLRDGDTIYQKILHTPL